MIKILSRYTGGNYDYIKYNDNETELEFVVNQPLDFIITGNVTAYVTNDETDKRVKVENVRHNLNSFFLSLSEDDYKVLGTGVVYVMFEMEDAECNYKEATGVLKFIISESLSQMEIVDENYKRPTESQEEIDKRKERIKEIKGVTNGLLNSGYSPKTGENYYND